MTTEECKEVASIHSILMNKGNLRHNNHVVIHNTTQCIREPFPNVAREQTICRVLTSQRVHWLIAMSHMTLCEPLCMFVTWSSQIPYSRKWIFTRGKYLHVSPCSSSGENIPSKILASNWKTVCMHACYIHIRHWGPPDSPGALPTSLLASGVKQLVDSCLHMLIKQNTMG